MHFNIWLENWSVSQCSRHRLKNSEHILIPNSYWYQENHLITKKGDGKHLILENVALGFQFEMNSLSLKHQNNLTFNLKKIFIGKASSNSQYIILYILQDILFYFNCFVFANFIMMSYCLYRISCPQPSWQEEGWSFFHTWLFCAGQAVGLLCCVCHRKKKLSAALILERRLTFLQIRWSSGWDFEVRTVGRW